MLALERNVLSYLMNCGVLW